MKKINTTILLMFIIILGAVLRLYQLGNNPPSLDWDEASLGYNAYSILKTGKDEYGTFLPLAIRSFGDYKPPLYTYLAVPTVAIFGLNEFAVRLPSALMGIIAIVATYQLVKEFCLREREKEWMAVISSLLLAISPWHLQFSRVAFEANVGLTFFIIGTWLFLKGLRSGIWLSLSAFAYALSLYSYHSPRLVAPIFVLGLSIWFWKRLAKMKKWVFAAFLVGILCSAPLIYTFRAGGQARFQSVTTLTSQGTLDQSIKFIEYDRSQKDIVGSYLHNRRIIYLLTALKGYIDHWNINFLFLTGDGPARHHAAGMGLLYIVEVPFVAIGMYQLIRHKKKWSVPVFFWFLIAPVASAITSGTPHAVRALLYLPTFQIFIAYGIFISYASIKQNSRFLRSLFSKLVVFIYLINIYYYLNSYYIHTPVEHALEWQYGYKQAVAKIKQFENEVDSIIMTYTYDQPYIYTLFYSPIDPTWYQNQWKGEEVKRAERSFGKYTFRAIDWQQDKERRNTLLIGTPGEIPEHASGLVAEIPFPNGQIAFRIVRL